MASTTATAPTYAVSPPQRVRDLSASGDPSLVKKIALEPVVAGPPLSMQRGTAWTAMIVAAALAASFADTARAADRSETGAAQANQARRPQVTPRKAALYNEMVSYRALEAGWDGVGSVAPSHGAIDSALSFLALLPDTVPLPETTVSADGEVGFFWKSPGVYIDVGFPASGRISYYASAHGNIARDSGPFDGSTISQELLTVISRARGNVLAREQQSLS